MIDKKLVKQLWIGSDDVRKIVNNLNARDVVDYNTYSTLIDFVNGVDVALKEVLDDLQ